MTPGILISFLQEESFFLRTDGLLVIGYLHLSIDFCQSFLVYTSGSSLISLAQLRLLDRFGPARVMIDRNLQVLYIHGKVDDYLTSLAASSLPIPERLGNHPNASQQDH